jgi:hypothetical protein
MAQTVTDFSELQTAIAAYEDATDDVTIEVEQNLTLTELVNIPANANGKTLTIKSANSTQTVTLTRGVSGNLFSVYADATLILEDIIIDGVINIPNKGTLVKVNSSGTFVMNDGAVIRNNENKDVPSRASGVHVNGTFTMNGGEISGNKGSGEISFGADKDIYIDGCGVYVEGGTFTMNNGKISKNTEGVGIVNFGIFTMNGGEISGNTDIINGGGVHVNSGGVFTMDGGKISENTASNGGGVYVHGSASKFTVSDGEISENSASNGSGVFISGGTLTMNNGKIRDNSNSGGGGGVVYVRGIFTMNGGEISRNIGNGLCVDGEFTMTGGEISGNGYGVFINSGTFTMNGGEISGNSSAGTFIQFDSTLFTMNEGKISNNSRGVEARSTFTMNGGEISGNFNGAEGGGVYVLVGPFTMNGGKISGNTAGGYVGMGGGVYVEGTFIMNGGEISNNTAYHDGSGMNVAYGAGGGVFVYSSTFIMNGGEISNNNASSGGGVYLYRTITSNAFFTMTEGKISGNNAYSGGGGYLYSNPRTNSAFDMTNGEICGNTSNNGGGVYISSGTFTMNGGEVCSNNAYSGGGVYVSVTSDLLLGTFTMNGGKISKNIASNLGGSVYVNSRRFTSGGDVYSGIFTMNSGAIAGFGRNVNDIIYGSYNFNSYDHPVPNNGIIIAWNKGTNSSVYIEGANTHLIALPTEDATAVWAIENDKFGISYKNDENEGFIEFVDVTVITLEEVEASCKADENNVWESNTCRAKTVQEQCAEVGNIWDGSCKTPAQISCEADDSNEWVGGVCKAKPTLIINLPQIATGNIRAYATANAIVLENVPSEAKVEVYNLHGKRIYMGNPENPLIMKIMVQTKGMYIVKVGGRGVLNTPATHRVVVK